jgi:predicted DNA-binding protein with PD1-like motif
MITQKEFLKEEKMIEDKELIHKIQRLAWQYELQEISINELIGLLKGIILEYQEKDETA